MGDLRLPPAISFQPISDQKSKCSLCEKVIFNILEKAHANSHTPSPIDFFKPSLPNASISGQTPAKPKAMQKTASAAIPDLPQESHEKISKAKGSAARKQKKSMLMDFEKMLSQAEVTALALPKKRVKKSVEKPSRSTHPVNYYFKKFFEYTMYLDKLLQVYKRCCHLQMLRKFRSWKKLGSPKIFNKPQ